MEAGKPVNIVFGTVISVPLEIQVDQKSIYTSKMLILTQNVTRLHHQYDGGHKTEDTAAEAGMRPLKPIITLYRNQIISGSERFEGREKVLLLRVQGGKKFVVIDG